MLEFGLTVRAAVADDPKQLKELARKVEADQQGEDPLPVTGPLAIPARHDED